MTEEQIQKIWEKGTVVTSYDVNKYRKDQCGAWIIRSEYGNRNSIYGWERDHIIPESNDGSGNLSNSRPLQHENNSTRHDERLTCPIVSSGNVNIRRAK